jgi:imidazolonepropionase
MISSDRCADMPVLRNIGVLATCVGPEQGDVGLVERAAVAWRDGIIAYVGPEAELPEVWSRDEVMDAGGRLVVPGLVDCHTHLAFGGWRGAESGIRCDRPARPVWRS